MFHEWYLGHLKWGIRFSEQPFQRYGHYWTSKVRPCYFVRRVSPNVRSNVERGYEIVSKMCVKPDQRNRCPNARCVPEWSRNNVKRRMDKVSFNISQSCNDNILNDFRMTLLQFLQDCGEELHRKTPLSLRGSINQLNLCRALLSKMEMGILGWIVLWDTGVGSLKGDVKDD